MVSAKTRVLPQGQIWRWVAMGGPLALLLACFLVYPVGQLLLLSIHNDNGFTLAQYRQLFASSVYVDVLLITLKISLMTTLVCVMTGYPIAYLISIVGKERKARLLFFVLLSFWTSFLVRAFAWVVLLGRNGVINKLLASLGMISTPAGLLYNFGSVLVGMVNALLPLAVLTMLSVMDNIDRNLPRAAATLGARPGMAFWKIYFPLSLPGVAAAGIMVFVTAIGFFIVPALLGGRRETMITQLIIDQIQQTMNWGFAGAISVLLLLVVLIVFAAYDRLLGLSTMTGAATARKAKPSRLSGPIQKAGDALLTMLGLLFDGIIDLLSSQRRKSNPDQPGLGLQVFVWLMLLVISLPTLLMIPLSFGSGGLNWPPQGFTLHWYETVLTSPVWAQALLRSLMVGVGTGLLAMLIGTPAAFLLVRSEIPAKAAWLAFILSPIVVPRMIIAVGLFYVFASIGLVGSALGLILGHTVVAVPYVVITMVAVLRNYDTRLDLAAQSLGARPVATLRYVTFPILGAGMMSSFLFAFATSFDELTIALFATGSLNATLPKQFWDEVTLQVSPVIAAVSTCLFVFMGLLIFFAERLRRRAAAT
ncbi:MULTISPECIES: ABC transporter permease subunit [unclassified Bradyrhizobium]|uniref:ABC transporter permease subunit n=1 Tax=unclassified Bradyrhizobium TaxID=2631580 RepID=UPI001FFADF4A|nr:MULTISPECIES: ABC transporter permease subunit [unclassified Bradyrhizobium]MCK1422431.1 ABC transporter permease subunit [Bradyrhizobium sp. CW12]MCK1649023.1 ABC transporter permease subunit [Bradyrhizobium sp. 154]